MSAACPVALSVVAPFFNEEAVLPAMYARTSAACAAVMGEDYEIVMVNDGSADAGWDLIAGYAAADPHVVAVDLSRNHGHQLALSAGLSLARGRRILIIDGDLQDPPELLAAMMALMDRGADVVYGRRIQRKGESWIKLLTAKLFYRIFRMLADIQAPLDSGDFRLISRRVLDVLNAMPEQHRFLRGMISWVGFRQVPFDYRRDERYAGKGKYRWTRMFALATDAITSFSVRPLRISSYFAVAFALCGVAAMAYVLLSWAAGVAVTGWTSLISVVLILGSAQLLVLGIIGEYLGRLVSESKRRPLYVIAEVRGLSRPPLGAHVEASAADAGPGPPC